MSTNLYQNVYELDNQYDDITKTIARLCFLYILSSLNCTQPFYKKKYFQRNLSTKTINIRFDIDRVKTSRLLTVIY